MQTSFYSYVINVFANLLYGLDTNLFEPNDSVFNRYIQSSLRNRGFNS